MNSNRDQPFPTPSKPNNLPLPSQLLDYFEHPLVSSRVDLTNKAKRMSKPMP